MFYMKILLFVHFNLKEFLVQLDFLYRELIEYVSSKYKNLVFLVSLCMGEACRPMVAESGYILSGVHYGW